MKNLILASAVLAALAFSGMAFGQGYVGGSIGQSDFKAECDAGFTCDTKDTGYKIFGGYMFSPNFGVEGPGSTSARPRRPPPARSCSTSTARRRP
jgi:OmpA-OmpF porin, OOP family